MHEKWRAGIPGSHLKGSHWSVWAGLRCSVAHPWAWLRVWLCQAGREAEQCEAGCGCQGQRGCSHHPFPQRLTSGTCSDLREEEGLKRKFSLCPSVGNGGFSFSHHDLIFWNHFYIFLISLSLPFPYLVVLISPFLILLPLIHLKISSNSLCLSISLL